LNVWDNSSNTETRAYIQYFKNGSLICQKHLEMGDETHQEDTTEHDIIIIQHPNGKDRKCITCNTPVHNPSCVHFTPSNIKFISFQLQYNGNVYDIELRNDLVNFYIQDTTIDSHFIHYYLTNISPKCSLSLNDLTSYSIMMIDHDANIRTLKETDAIVIHQDNFNIISISPPAR
jgi:hypothetical protein